MLAIEFLDFLDAPPSPFPVFRSLLLLHTNLSLSAVCVTRETGHTHNNAVCVISGLDAGWRLPPPSRRPYFLLIF